MLVTDALEGIPVGAVADVVASPTTLLLELPEETAGEQLVARWEFGPEGGVSRLLYRNGTLESTHVYPTKLKVTWMLDSDQPRSRIQIFAVDGGSVAW